jgi:UDP-N-acetylmuramate dehydrogenase
VKALIHENVPLAPLTTFDIGGPARYFIDAADEQTVLDGVHWAKDRDLPLFVMGGGSNLLVADAGFEGLVIKMGIRGIEWVGNNGTITVAGGAGESWDRLVALAVERDLAGIECLSGIPGSLGGTPVQNVGAYGQEVSEVITNVRVFDRNSDCAVELSRGDCGFMYRTSIFNTVAKDRYVVLSVTLALRQNGEPTLRYPDVLREVDGQGGTPTLSQVRAAVLRIRQRKAMLLVDGDADCRSAGSFFKNPVITDHQFMEVQAIAGHAMPRYPAGPGKVKTAAAWLIEQAGFSKGYSLGPVGLSSRHTLALINKGGARAEDVLRLAREIRGRVRDRFGIDLLPEPVLLGFPNAGMD